MISALRMELLDNEMSRDLVETLSGLLMIMPQTAAFRLLRDRLGCLPTVQRYTNNKFPSFLALFSYNSRCIGFTSARSLRRPPIWQLTLAS